MLSALKLTVAAVLVSTSLTCLLLQRQFPSATAPRGTTIAAAARPAAATRLALRIPKPGAVASQLPGQRDSILHVTFASSSVTELLHNWALHVQRLRFAAVVAAIDLETAAFCEELGVHHLLAGGGALTGALTAERARLGGRANVRGNATLFLALGASKVDAVAYLLRLGQRPVVVSDVDVAWLSDPTPMVRGTLPGLADFAHADLLASSDCVSAEWDVEDDGCFHTLIDRNTGVLVVRPNDKSAAFLGEWAERTAGAFQAWETDQTAFDDLLRGRRRGHRRASTEAEREAWLRRKKDYCGLPPTTSEESTMGQRSLRPNGVPHATGSRYLYDVCIPGVSRAFTFGIMPVSLVANGHTFFVQQLQTQTGVQPMAVHATYQFGDLADCAFGKRERFREWGLWRVPDDSLLASLAAPEVAPEPDRARAARAPARKAAARAADGAGRHVGVARPAAPPAGEARLLVLHDDDAPLPPPAAWDSERDPHARGRQHVEHVNALLRRLAAGVALGRALNRTVVLPRMYCYCDRYWARLTECTIGRQALPTQPLPFRCPMDHLLPIGGWHGAEANRLARPRCAGPTRPDGPPEEGFPYRTAAWLERLRESAPFFVSSATVRPDGGGRSDSATSRGPRHGALLAHGHTISLPAGASDVRLREAFREAAGRWSQRQPPPAVPLAASREPTLLHVSLEDAASLLGCTSEQPVLATLFQRLFSNRWCYRPEEMTEVRKTANGTVDVCVWGFELPAPPKQCASNAGGAPL